MIPDHQAVVVRLNLKTGSIEVPESVIEPALGYVAYSEGLNCSLHNSRLVLFPPRLPFPSFHEVLDELHDHLNPSSYL